MYVYIKFANVPGAALGGGGRGESAGDGAGLGEGDGAGRGHGVGLGAVGERGWLRAVGLVVSQDLGDNVRHRRAGVHDGGRGEAGHGGSGGDGVAHGDGGVFLVDEGLLVAEEKKRRS